MNNSEKNNFKGEINNNNAKFYKNKINSIRMKMRLGENDINQKIYFLNKSEEINNNNVEIYIN